MSPNIANYSRVRLLTDRYSAEGARAGATGYIIEIHGEDAYEIEFADTQGITYAQIVVQHDEMEVCEPLEFVDTDVLNET